MNKPAVAEDVRLLKQPYREQVQAFMAQGTLPANPSDQFVQAVNDALHGLEKVVINGTEFILALTQAGMPCTAEEIRQRLDDLIEKQLEGKKRDKVRIEIDW